MPQGAEFPSEPQPDQTIHDQDIQKKTKPLKFRKGDPGWRDEPDSTEQQELDREYEAMNREMKILSEASDAAVLATHYRILMNHVFPPGYFELRPWDDKSFDLDDILSRMGSAQTVYNGIPDAYHPHGRHAQATVSENLHQSAKSLDMVGRNKNCNEFNLRVFILAAVHGVEGMAGLKFNDIGEVFQYGPTYVVVLSDEFYNARFLPSLAFHANKYLFCSQSTLNDEHLSVLLSHEYAHAVDTATQRTWTSPEKEESNYNGVVALYKTEFAASIAMYAINTPVDSVAFWVRDAYLAEFVKQFGPGCEPQLNAITAATAKIDPYIRGLILEMGEDPGDLQLRSLLLRTFITTLPDREISIRLLEDLQKTSVYEAGEQYLMSQK